MAVRFNKFAPAHSDVTTPTELVKLGLRVGDVVRFRRNEKTNWRQGVVARREKDGSVGIFDADGASRAITADRLQVRRLGKRGGVVWAPVADLAEDPDQLRLC